ncbi:MAG TPA: MFS transporter [Gaiellaceae bacterium]|nr:MFS transporter [Gaiellaceae bacterium]
MAREGGIGVRAAAGGIGIGLAVGWNIASLGAIATRLSSAYGVGLATIGLFTTVQFVMHMVMQVPGGRAADRWGARTSSLVGLSLIALGNAIALVGAYPGLGFGGRAIVGLGTGFGFVGGSDYIRARGGSPLVQGLYGGSSVLSPGIALALVPGLANWTGFRAPYLSGLVVVALCGAVLVLAPAAPRTVRHAAERLDFGFVRDRRLHRLAVVHSVSFGFSVVVGNWVVTLLEHHGQPKGAAAAAGSLTLLLSFFTRVAGGPLLRRSDAHRFVAASLVLGGAGCALLALPLPLPALVAAAGLVGLAAGLPFAMVFTGSALARPDAPGAAIGFVNSFASLTIVAGTPLVGLTFSLPGDGRIGFLVVAALAVLAAPATPRVAAH